MKTIATILLALTISLAWAQQDRTINFSWEQTPRKFVLHIPANIDTSTPAPLVISMHGLGTDMNLQKLYSNMDGIADTAGFFIVYPQGLTPSGSGFSWNLDPAFAPDDIGMISHIIDRVWTEYNIDLTKVYATGLSQGGFMSFGLSCLLEDRITAMASVAGAMPEQLVDTCQGLTQKPVMQIHGTADLVVDINGLPGLFVSTDSLISFWVAQNNCPNPPVVDSLPNINIADSTTVVRFTYQNCANNTEVVFYKIDEGGHTWPDGLIDFATLGYTNRDFNASETIWNFFNKHQNANPRAGTVVSLPTSTNDLVIESGEYELFPNPASNRLQIRSTTASFNQVSVWSTVGEEILNYTYDVPLQQTNLDLSELQSGLYLIHLSDGTSTSIHRIMKQ